MAPGAGLARELVAFANASGGRVFLGVGDDAVAHRDYSVYGAHTTVDVFDDRIEISNPGGLVRGLTPEMFGRRAIRRNQIVTGLLHRLGFVENMGTGISKIRDLLVAAGRAPAEYEFGGFFTVTFRRPIEWDGGVSGGVSEGVSEGVAAALCAIRIQPGQRVPEIAARMVRPAKTVERWIGELRDRGLIEFRGSPKTGGYWPTGSKNGTQQ